MSPRTAKKSTKSNDDALAAFIARKDEIDTMLQRLQRLSDDHFGVAPDEVTWGHVGNQRRRRASEGLHRTVTIGATSSAPLVRYCIRGGPGRSP